MPLRGKDVMRKRQEVTPFERLQATTKALQEANTAYQEAHKAAKLESVVMTQGPGSLLPILYIKGYAFTILDGKLIAKELTQLLGLSAADLGLPETED